MMIDDDATPPNPTAWEWLLSSQGLFSASVRRESCRGGCFGFGWSARDLCGTWTDRIRILSEPG